MTLDEISRELEATRKTAKTEFDPGRHKALLIGINDYDDSSWQRLQTPIRDVNEIKKLLTNDYLFSEEDVVLLENATFEEIISAFSKIRKETDENTNLFIYYAGHGYYDKIAQKAYWQPVDAELDSDSKWIIVDSITSNIKRANSKHILIVADSCYSGTLTRGSMSEMTNINTLHEKYIRKIFGKKITKIGPCFGSNLCKFLYLFAYHFSSFINLLLL